MHALPNLFQFPSSGKGYAKVIEALGEDPSIDGFNSLRAGKGMQRDPILHPVGPWLRRHKTKRELREAVSGFKIRPENLTNPDKH